MIEVVMGIIFIVVPVLFGFIIFGFAGGITTGILFWAMLAFLSIFLVIGIAFLVIGLKKLFTDKLTDRKGVDTIGVVADIMPDNISVNDRCYYKVKVRFYDSQNVLRNLEERIGQDPEKYRIGDLINIRYYRDDVNIMGTVDEKQLSYGERRKLDKLMDVRANLQSMDIHFEEGTDVVVVNGIRYRKE